MSMSSPSLFQHCAKVAAGDHTVPAPATTSLNLQFRRLSVLELSARSGAFPVDLWCCNVDDLPAGLLDDPLACGMLSLTEQCRLRAFRFNRDRLRHLAGRLLLRCILSRYAGVAPAELQFTKNAFGRPELIPEAAAARGSQASTRALRFSLSRAGSLAVLAVSRMGEVGVDLEDTHRSIASGEVAPGVLAKQELEVFYATPAPARQATFLRYWVLKEAYAKARGMGLSLDVRRASFTPPGPGPIRVHLGTGIADASARWQFAYAPLSDRYPLAVAYRPDTE